MINLKKYGLPAAALALAIVLSAGCGSGSGGGYDKYMTLGDYKGLGAVLTVEDVTDDELDGYVLEQLDEYTEYVDAEGPVSEGQLVTTELLAESGGETVYDFRDDGYDILVGEEEYGPEVDAALSGHYAGDEISLTVDYDEDFVDAALCGKAVDFDIKVVAIYDVVYPELTDGFVRENFGEETADAWRASLKDELYESHRADAEEEMRDELVQQVIDGSEIKGCPDDLYEEKLAEAEEEYQGYADMFGCSVDEVYDMLGTDEQTVEEDARNAAYRSMALELIREREGIVLTDEMLQERLEDYAGENDYESVDELLAEYDEEGLRQYFLDQMAIDFIEEHASVS